jgi:hypothetical protein
MRATFLKGVALGAAVSSVTLVTSAAVAGNGVGKIFNLGQTNTVNQTTKLTGSTNGRQLSVVNSSSGAAATGVGINVAAGKPPLQVNSSALVQNLNANYLGGTASSGFMHGVGGTTQSGLIQIAFGGSVLLASVPNLGALWGNCVNAASANVVLETNSSLGQFLYSNPQGNTYAVGGTTISIVGSGQVGFGSGLISSGSHTASVEAATNVPFPSTGQCWFMAQVTASG